MDGKRGNRATHLFPYSPEICVCSGIDVQRCNSEKSKAALTGTGRLAHGGSASYSGDDGEDGRGLFEANNEVGMEGGVGGGEGCTRMADDVCRGVRGSNAYKGYLFLSSLLMNG
ncbi:hypothetical protein RRG08_037393 [Elysia crispata]|uniref:Uncharacterized protein n=1 Tax=Elysia crispata TaxID=231223 RepID=A0AAE1DZ55_9GAST|nr:hypothetical protein RRG08_037393 [Elysia crispata]